MNITIKDRLQIFIKFLGISTRKFEIECGLTNGYVMGTSENGYTATKLISIFKKFPTLSTRWLLLGEGDMIRNSENTSDISDTFLIPDPMPILPASEMPPPVIGTKMGKIIPVNVKELKQPISDYIQNTELSSWDFAAITGEYMFAYKIQTTLLEPVLYQDDWILLDHASPDNIVSGNIYLVDSRTYGKMIKRVEQTGDEFICTLPISKADYPSVTLPASDIYDFYEIVTRINANSIPRIFANHADIAEYVRITEQIIENHTAEIENHKKALDIIDKTISMIKANH